MKQFLLFISLMLVSLPAFSATCKISEYRQMVSDPSGLEVPVAAEPAVVQTVTYTTASLSAAFQSSTRFVRIICDAKAHFIFSEAGATAATANSPYLAADVAEYFGLLSTSVLISFYDGTS